MNKAARRTTKNYGVPMYKVAIADDHPVIIQALKFALKSIPDLQIVVECSTGDDLLNALRTTTCDAIITDFSMVEEQDATNTSGLDLVRKLRHLQPNARLIVYTMALNPWVISSLLNLKIDALISKLDELDEVPRVCRELVQRKRSYISPAIRRTLEERGNMLGENVTSGTLTPKELEIVRLFAGGAKLTEIAARLNRAPGTISAHKFNAMQKLGITSNSELVKYAMDHDLS